MAVNLSPVGGVAAQFFTNSGYVLTGGKLFTYSAGTTTPATTYTTSQGNVAWTNPIVLDAAGRVPNSGEIWLVDGANYKFVLKDSNDVLIATYDNISGINSNFIAYTNEQEIQSATAGQTVFTLTTMNYLPGTNSLSVFVDGVNQYGPGAQYSYVETDASTVTFNAGLHYGAEVKFTSTQQQGAGAVDASQVSYDPPFTNSVVTNVEAKLAQTVSVIDFGADPTGAVDSTQAFQDAIDTGGGVYVPTGTYIISSQLNLATNTFLYGEGQESVLKYTGSGIAMQITAGSGPNGKEQFVTLDNFRLESTGGTVGIQVYTTYHVTINRVRIWGYNTGFSFGAISIYSNNVNNSANINILNCNIQTAAGHGIIFDQPLAAGTGIAASRISGNRIQANQKWGIFCDSDTPVEVSIIGNDIEGNALGGIRIDYVFGCSIISNHLEYGSSGVVALALGGTGVNGRVYSSVVLSNNISTNSPAYNSVLNNFQNSNYSCNYSVGYATGEVQVNGSTANSCIGTNTPNLTRFNNITATNLTVDSNTVVDTIAGVHLKSYSATDIANIAYILNTDYKSAGKMVWDSTNSKIKVATGSLPASTWVDANGANPVTPS